MPTSFAITKAAFSKRARFFTLPWKRRDGPFGLGRKHLFHQIHRAQPGQADAKGYEGQINRAIARKYPVFAGSVFSRNSANTTVRNALSERILFLAFPFGSFGTLSFSATFINGSFTGAARLAKIRTPNSQLFGVMRSLNSRGVLIRGILIVKRIPGLPATATHNLNFEYRHIVQTLHKIINTHSNRGEGSDPL
jgi:hypothetical protein